MPVMSDGERKAGRQGRWWLIAYLAAGLSSVVLAVYPLCRPVYIQWGTDVFFVSTRHSFEPWRGAYHDKGGFDRPVECWGITLGGVDCFVCRLGFAQLNGGTIRPISIMKSATKRITR